MLRRRRPARSPVASLAATLVLLLVAGGLIAACTLAGSAAAPAPGGPSGPSGSPRASGPTRPYRPTPAPAPTFATYTVRSGDTMIRLATRFETTPQSLAYWNRARYPSLDPDSPTYDPDRIEVGWELVYLPGEVVDPENLPPASEAPTTDPGAVGPFPTLPADGSAVLVRRGPTGLDAVALTFDYAGGAGAGDLGADALIQWLAANGVPATVFVSDAATGPGDGAAEAVLARLAGHPNGIGIGILARMDDAAGLSNALASADAALAAKLGTSTAPRARPARGIASADALRAAGAAGWTWAIAWDVDPGDETPPASGGPIASDIVARVVSQAEGGSIVRLQLGGARTLEALPGILDGLASAGLRVVPLDLVLGLAAGE